MPGTPQDARNARQVAGQHHTPLNGRVFLPEGEAGDTDRLAHKIIIHCDSQRQRERGRETYRVSKGTWPGTSILIG